MTTVALNVALSYTAKTQSMLGIVYHAIWRARIKSGTTYKSLGLFKNEEDAAKAYDKAAMDMHGEFANLNFKDEAFDSGIIIDKKTLH